MKTPTRHQHGSAVLFGSLLEAGDVAALGDQYDSTSGGWSDFPCPGLVVQADAGARIVRPVYPDDPERTS